jgi:hypothetical protein
MLLAPVLQGTAGRETTVQSSTKARTTCRRAYCSARRPSGLPRAGSTRPHLVAVELVGDLLASTSPNGSPPIPAQASHRRCGDPRREWRVGLHTWSDDYRRGFTFKARPFGVRFNEPPLRDRVEIAKQSSRVPATTHQRNSSSPWAGWSGPFVRACEAILRRSVLATWL